MTRIDSQQALLGTLILYPESFDLLPMGFRPDHFSTHANREIYEAIIAVAESGDQWDYRTICAKLGDRLEIVGGTASIVSIVAEAASPGLVVRYAENVMDEGNHQMVVKMAREVLGKSDDEDGHGLRKFLDEKYSDLDKIDDTAVIHDSKSLMRDAVDHMESVLDGVHSVPLVRSLQEGQFDSSKDLFRLNELYGGGLGRGGLHIIAARPNIGKTTLAALINYEVATLGFNSLFFSLEMPANEISRKLILQAGGDDINDVKRNDAAVMGAIGRISELPINILCRGGLTVSDIIRTIRKVERKSKRKIDAIFIDYLQIMEFPQGETRNLDVGKATMQLKALAMNSDIPVVLLSQLNRGGEGRRPRLSDLRDSGSIEQDADTVLFLHGDPNSQKMPNYRELILAKNRHGPTGHEDYWLDGPRQRIRPAMPHEMVQADDEGRKGIRR